MDGQPHREGRFHTRCTGEIQRSAVGFDGAADDAEAEAGALDLRAVMLVAAIEAFEDEGQVVCGDADAVVAHA